MEREDYVYCSSGELVNAREWLPVRVNRAKRTITQNRALTQTQTKKPSTRLVCCCWLRGLPSRFGVLHGLLFGLLFIRVLSETVVLCVVFGIGSLRTVHSRSTPQRRSVYEFTIIYIIACSVAHSPIIYTLHFEVHTHTLAKSLERIRRVARSLNIARYCELNFLVVAHTHIAIPIRNRVSVL